MNPIRLFLLLTGFCVLPSLFAEPDPEAYLREAMGNPGLRNVEFGEQYCWHVNSGAGVFLDAYEAYQNPEWLSAAVRYYDAAIANLSTDPDGYPGWIGPPIGSEGNATYLTDTVVGDSILVRHFLRFAELVKTNPALAERFGAKAQAYTELAARICWEKYEHRKQYYQCAEGYVSYPTYHKVVDAKAGEWVEQPSRVISDNLNKHYDIGIVYLRLWRLTGEEKYRDRVLRIFGRHKAILRHYPEEDRVVWNFWMPHGPYDIVGSSTKSWVAVHHDRSGYQSGEVSMFVEVYDSGLVYSWEDLQRMIRTNLWMSRNQWVNAEGGTAGQLWPALVRFSPELRAMYEKQLEGARGIRGEVQRDYHQNVTLKQLNDRRLYVQDPSKVQEVHPPLQPGRELSMALPIPNQLALKQQQRIQLACKTRSAGELTIELLAGDRETVLKKLETISVKEPRGEYAAPLWDGSGTRGVGDYYIRWTLNGESRMERVVVVEGSADAVVQAQAELQPGQSVKIDFEQPLDARIWTVEDAVPSKAQARTGTQSLEVKRSAILQFGRDKQRDLPVKISMWVFDSGLQHRGNGDGPAWGVQDTLGNKFCLRMVWRGYLNGNQQYSWLNTGENQWFNPHPSGLLRNQGWNHWVFDFSGEVPVVSLNGKVMRDGGNKFIPRGAVAVYLLNGNHGGPLYVDDLEISYPAP